MAATAAGSGAGSVTVPWTVAYATGTSAGKSMVKAPV